jgi:simple sugar transport system ATP-binding protein
MNLCQRATVLRRGRVVGEVDIARSSPAELARLMVGHDIEAFERQPPRAPGPVRLALRAVSATDDRGLPALSRVSLDVRAGEILGIAGVEGNGQHELAEVLIGRRAVSSGDILLNDQTITRTSVRARRQSGLAIIPEDRNREGLSQPLSLWENFSANDYFAPPHARAGWMHVRRLQARARDYLARFDIRAPAETVALKTLSGGNAQKVVIARELGGQPQVLIAAQPTRGLDIGATRFVHDQLLALRLAGVAVLLISADLDELLALSDRIAVLYAGRITAQMAATQAQREQLGLFMAGKSMEVAS